MVAEALNDDLFITRWNDECDLSFRPFAAAVFRSGEISGLATAARRERYREIATQSRARIMSRTFGRKFSSGDLRLTSKVEWRTFTDRDWSRLWDAAQDPKVRRAFGHLVRIRPRLVRQLGYVPSLLQLPHVFLVLNRLSLPAEHWLRLKSAIAGATNDNRLAWSKSARRIRSIGDFWDFWFLRASHDDIAKLPPEMPTSTLLIPLLSAAQMRAEGRRLGNCLGALACRVKTGDNLYFKVTGEAPGVAELYRSGNVWNAGNISGIRDTKLPEIIEGHIFDILMKMAVVLTNIKVVSSVDSQYSIIEALRYQARSRFSPLEIAYLTGLLRNVHPHSDAARQSNGLDVVFYGKSEECSMNFISDLTGDAYSIYIKSHQRRARLERFLDCATVNFIEEAGFLWPNDSSNLQFHMRFKIQSPDDFEALAEFSLAILDRIFKYRSGQKPWVRTSVVSDLIENDGARYQCDYSN